MRTNFKKSVLFNVSEAVHMIDGFPDLSRNARGFPQSCQEDRNFVSTTNSGGIKNRQNFDVQKQNTIQEIW
jgi:hypothetical protein